MAQILIIEDDPAILRGLYDNLCFEGYQVLTAHDAQEGYDLMIRESPDLIVLDVMLPRGNGFELCRRIREQGISTPVLMLTARGSEFDRVMGLDLGADDYVTKPFSILEVLARIRALLRRIQTSTEEPDHLVLNDIEIDFRRFETTQNGQALHLTRKEYGILKSLCARPGEVVTRDELLNEVWGTNQYPSTRTVDNHIAMLRSKLEPRPDAPTYLQTVHGVGYKLVL